uniref:Interleukin 17 receptor E n=1 Tax=Strix occidentalis caurina TaxID=311401 RepID=A0A8D0FZK8_STROC
MGAHPTAWNVSMSIWGLQLRLHLISSIPAAFSAALCQRRGGQCEPEAPLYTVTQPEGSAPGELALLLPVQVLGSCVLVWRSDVHFARKQLLCPDGEWGSRRVCGRVHRHPLPSPPLSQSPADTLGCWGWRWRWDWW